jgi:hypothetical protein
LSCCVVSTGVLMSDTLNPVTGATPQRLSRQQSAGLLEMLCQSCSSL